MKASETHKTDSILEVRDAAVHFGGLKAFSGVSLAVGEGEIIGLLGPNGAGKTTLLNTLTGFQPLTSGEFLLDGESMVDASPAQLARAGIARSFQSVRLFKELTVRENIMTSALVCRKRRDASLATKGLIERFGLVESANQLAGSLPYARERMVGIARALALEPRFLLLDEPAAGMTDAEMKELSELLRGIVRDFHCSIVLVEHNMQVITECCDRLHVLAEGRTLITGTWDQVSNDAGFRTAYLGESA